MDFDNESEFEYDLNIGFDMYARHFMANEERYGDEGFLFYQVQNGLEGAPRASDVKQDLETMAESGLLEKDVIGGFSKMPNTEYVLAGDEQTFIRSYLEDTRDWNDDYVDSLTETLNGAIQ